jgi:hypothetical protein
MEVDEWGTASSEEMGFQLLRMDFDLKRAKEELDSFEVRRWRMKK